MVLLKEVYFEQLVDYVMYTRKIKGLEGSFIWIEISTNLLVYKRIDSCFIYHGFQMCFDDHVLYIKFIEHGDTLIICMPL